MDDLIEKFSVEEVESFEAQDSKEKFVSDSDDVWDDAAIVRTFHTALRLHGDKNLETGGPWREQPLGLEEKKQLSLEKKSKGLKESNKAKDKNQEEQEQEQEQEQEWSQAEWQQWQQWHFQQGQQWQWQQQQQPQFHQQQQPHFHQQQQPHFHQQQQPQFNQQQQPQFNQQQQPQFNFGNISNQGLYPEDESLASLLQAWYYSGYQTGRYQAIQEMKRNSSKE